MPVQFQFGNEHHLYLLLDSNNKAVALNSRPGQTNPTPPTPAITYNSIPGGAAWTLYDAIRDLNVGGNDNTVDVTTRDEARLGFSTEVVVTTGGEMTFEVRYKRRTDVGSFGTVQDFAHEALLRAWLAKTEIAAIDLDQALGTAGAQGLVANWSVTFGLAKPVQGMLASNITLRMSTFPDWIVKQTSTTTLDFDKLTNI